MNENKSVAISQSNYLPWKGYFDLINDVDLFIFYDDVQFTRSDWRYRNKVKRSTGLQWLSVPVGGSQNSLICEVAPVNQHWQKKHWQTLRHLYSKTPYFMKYRGFLESVYLEHSWDSLSQLNQYLIKRIARNYLGVKTEFLNSSDFPKKGKKQEALINLLKAVNADVYISGPSAKTYIDPQVFKDSGIKLIWKDYSGYPEYSQFHPPFRHDVSILDLLFHVGPDSPSYIWGWRSGRGYESIGSI